jgi:hypothetical protein
MCKFFALQFWDQWLTTIVEFQIHFIFENQFERIENFDYLIIIEFHKNSEVKPISIRTVQQGGCLRTWGQPNETFSKGIWDKWNAMYVLSS